MRTWVLRIWVLVWLTLVWLLLWGSVSAANVAWWLVLSSTQVAWLALRPGPPPLSAVLRARLALKSDLVLALAVNIMNLTPGTIVLEIDQTRRLVYVHVLDVGSQRSVDRFYQQVTKLERMLVASFERDSEWQPVASESEEAAT